MAPGKKSQPFGTCLREIDTAALNVGSAVSDPGDERSAVLQICHLDSGPEGKGFVSQVCGIVLVEPLSIGHGVAMESGSIPGRPTLLHPRVCRGGERHRNGSPQQNACQTFSNQLLLHTLQYSAQP